MAARLPVAIVCGVIVLAGEPVFAQHHDTPAKPAAKAESSHAEPAARAKAAAAPRADSHGAGSLGAIAPVAPAVTPVGHGRAKAAGSTVEAHADDKASPPSTSGVRRKSDGLKKGSSPADVAASINQRLAELAELRRTAPVALPRRPVTKRDVAPETAAAPAPIPASAPVAKPSEPARPAIKLQWRVPVTWPAEMPLEGAS